MGKLKISIHPLYILMGILLFVLGNGFAFIAYSITIVLHEMAHSEVARRLGYALDDINLMPYGAELTGALEGVKTREEILIAIAGPIFNVFLAIIFVALFWLIPSTYFFTETFVTANIVTAAVNLIPVFPLDGGRVFLALLSRKLPIKKAVSIAQKTGIVVAIIFAAAFVLTVFLFEVNFSLIIIAVFMLASALTSYKKQSYKRIISRTYRRSNLKKGLIAREIIVPCEMLIKDIYKKMTGNYYYKIIVVDQNMQSVAALTETEFDDILTSHSICQPIGETVGQLGKAR